MEKKEFIPLQAKEIRKLKSRKNNSADMLVANSRIPGDLYLKGES